MGLRLCTRLAAAAALVALAIAPGRSSAQSDSPSTPISYAFYQSLVGPSPEPQPARQTVARPLNKPSAPVPTAANDGRATPSAPDPRPRMPDQLESSGSLAPPSPFMK